MLRAIGSVVVGYLTMAVIVFGGLTVAYISLGADRAFEPGGYDISKLWLSVMFVVGVVAALAGGFVAKLIAGACTPPKVLAGIVLVLGVALTIPTMGTPPPQEPRTAAVSNLEAMGKARTPAWAGFANALIGCIGVMVGAGMGKQRAGGRPI